MDFFSNPLISPSPNCNYSSRKIPSLPRSVIAITSGLIVVWRTLLVSCTESINSEIYFSFGPFDSRRSTRFLSVRGSDGVLSLSHCDVL